ncbi:MAG: putative peptidoglycan lipid II flippase [Candidatus Azotimanducaceae bacterium]|jgi:putative peptidoglycan lipid II flippase
MKSKRQISSSLARMFSGNMVVTALNLLRDLSIAAYFGASLLSDYYFLAIMFPVFFVTVLGGAYRSTVIPLLETFAVSSGEKVHHLLSQLNSGVLRTAVKFGGVYLVGAWLVLWLTGNEELEVNDWPIICLFIAVIPVYVLSAYLECNIGHMQFFRRFFFGSVLRFGLALGTILGCLLLTDWLSVYALPVGGAVGVILVIFILSWQHRREKILPSFSSRLDPGTTKRLVYSIGALSVGTSMAYVNPIVDQLVASTLGEGSIAMLGYSNRIATGLSSLTAGAIGPVLLVYYSNIAVSGNRTELQDLFNRAFVLCCWLSCALVVVVATYALDLVDLMYTRGNMSRDASREVGVLVQYYSCQYLPLIASAAVYPVISALNLNKVFVPINLMLLVVNLFADIVLSRYYGLAGIAISTVVVYSVSLCLMVGFLYMNGHVKLRGMSCASALVAVLSALVAYYLASSLKELSNVTLLGVNLLQSTVIAMYGFFVLWVCRAIYKNLEPVKNVNVNVN